MSHSRDRVIHEKQSSGKGRTDWKKTAIRICGPWSEQMSSKKKIYYYNCETEVSQWQRPKEWTLPDIDGNLLQASYDARVRRQAENRPAQTHSKRSHDGDSTVESNCRPHDNSYLSEHNDSTSNVQNKRPRLESSQPRSVVQVAPSYNRSHSLFTASCADNPSSQNSKYETQHSTPSSATYGATSVTSAIPNRTSHLCNNDDMDISPGSSPLSGKSGSDSLEASPCDTFHRPTAQRNAPPHSSTFTEAAPVSTPQKRPCTEEDLIQVVNSLLTTIASLFNAGDEKVKQKNGSQDSLPQRNTTNPDLLRALQAALLSYSESTCTSYLPPASEHNKSSSQPAHNNNNSLSLSASSFTSASGGVRSSNDSSSSSSNPQQAADRLYMQLEEVLSSAQVGASTCNSVESAGAGGCSTSRVNGDRHPSESMDQPAALQANSQLQKLLLRIKQRPHTGHIPPNGGSSSSSSSHNNPQSTNTSTGIATLPLNPQAILEALVSGLTQVAGALSNSVPSKTPSTPSSRSQPPPFDLYLSQEAITAQPASRRASVPGSFSPITLPPVMSASLAVKEIPTLDDVNRLNALLTNAKIGRYVDPTLVQKYCDPIADRLVKEALLEQQKFDKLQSVLYGELCCESKTLRALVRIPEIQASLHQLKYEFFQNLTECISQRKPAISFYDST